MPLRGAALQGSAGAGREARLIEGKIVVLVDDVSTTGAMLEACGRKLKEMGGREVRGVTVAAATKESLRPRPRPHRRDAPHPRAPSSGGPPV